MKKLNPLSELILGQLCLCIAVILLLMLITICADTFEIYSNEKSNHKTVTVTVTGLDNIDNLVYVKDSDGETHIYAVAGIFPPRNISFYNIKQLEIDKTYVFEVAGIRNERKNLYPVIYSVEEVK